jgi:polyhydroxyalkanoate synthesis regulator phasin
MSESAGETQPREESAPKNLGGRLREAWMKTVGTFATDESGTQSLLQRLVDFGHLSAEEAKKVLADARARIEENKGELDKRVDESMKKVTERFSSDAKEAKRLEERIAELEARLKELESAPG